MFKKLITVSILSIALLTFIGTSAQAYPAIASGGWGAWPVGSIEVWSEWLKVANAEKTPTRILVTLQPTAVQFHYINPGGQGGGVSDNFYPNIILTGDDVPIPEKISKNGNYTSTVYFGDDVLEAAILASGQYPDPPNPNWQLDPDGAITVNEMFVTIRGYSDMDENLHTGEFGAEYETAHLAGTCTLNVDGTAYICETEETWGWSKKDPEGICPWEPSPEE